MAGKIDATVRLASFNYRAVYKEPMIRAWSQRSGEIGQALYAAFRRWDISLEQASAAQLEFAGQEVTLEMHLSPAGATAGELTHGFVPSRPEDLGRRAKSLRILLAH